MLSRDDAKEIEKKAKAKLLEMSFDVETANKNKLISAIAAAISEAIKHYDQIR